VVTRWTASGIHQVDMMPIRSGPCSSSYQRLKIPDSLAIALIVTLKHRCPQQGEIDVRHAARRRGAGGMLVVPDNHVQVDRLPETLAFQQNQQRLGERRIRRKFSIVEPSLQIRFRNAEINADPEQCEQRGGGCLFDAS
jgi:hypothetical protein